MIHRSNRAKRASVSAALAVVLAFVTACQSGTARPIEPTASPTPIPATATPLPSKPDVAYTPVPGSEPSPIVVQRTPASGERLHIDSGVTLVFDREMNRASVETAWRIQPDVAGALEWVDVRTVNFKPSAALPRDATFDVTLTQDARAQDGAMLREPYQFRFQTQGHLEVGQVIPADNAQDVQPDTVVTVMFNRPVVPLTTLSNPAVALESPLSIDPPVEGEAEWMNTSILVFRPAKPLPGGTVFTARIPAGLQDTDGNPLAADFVWSFSTSAPKVLFVRPDPQDQRRAPIDTPIEVRFNQDVEPASAQAAFALFNNRGDPVDGAFRVTDGTLIFTPTQRLDFASVYAIRVAPGVKSASGGVGSIEGWESSFVTVPLPEIVRTEPADGERNAYYRTPFVIYFNTAIAPATVMPHVRVTPAISPTQVYTYYNEWDYSFGIYFDPQPATDYVVDIEPGISDPYGNLTSDRLRVSFRTGDREAYARIAAPGGVSTLNAYLPAQLIATTVNVKSLDLELTALDPADVRALAGDRDEVVRMPDRPVRLWRQAVEGQPNQVAYTRINLAEDGGSLPPGVYALRATSPEVPDNQFSELLVLVVSEINLAIKTEPSGALVWATDLKTGQPVPGLSLNVYNAQYGQPYRITRLGQGVTGSDGVARVAFDRAAAGRYYDAVIATADTRYAAVSNQWSGGISGYDFDIGYGPAYYPRADGSPALRGYLYTERPIYRPGQTVYFRGLVRQEDDVQYNLLPAGRDVRVRVTDAIGQQVFDKRLPLDEYGAFNAAVPIDEGGALGGYNIVAEMGDEGIAYTSFTVSNYRPPEYEVTVEPGAAEIARDTVLTATITAQYLSGGALRNAAVQWNVLASTSWFDPPQLEQYTFIDSDNPWVCFDCWYYRRNEPPPMPLFSGSGFTDERGQLMLSLPITTELWSNYGTLISGPVSLSIEANVTGADNQSIAGRSSVMVHPGSFYLGIALNEYVLQAGKPVTVELVAVDWQGLRLPGRNLEVQLIRREWKNSYDEAMGRWNYETVDELLSAVPVSSDAQGEARVVVTPTQAGAYRIVARAVDEAGRPIQSSRFVWAIGDEYVSWRRENNDRVNLIANKATFRVGETARILIPSPFEGEHLALVTVERGHILQHQLVRMTSNSQVYELPIEPGHVPNVYVSVILFRGMPAPSAGGEAGGNADFKVGYINLRVEPIQQVISLTLAPDRPLAQPGETVTYTLQATDSEGKPVVGQFSLDLVDKGILNLMPRPQNEIVDAFYGPRGLSVQTAVGLTVSANRQNEQQEEELAAQNDSRDGGVMVEEAMPAPSATQSPEAAMAPGVSKSAQAAGPVVRQNFADTGYWAPAVVSDGEGRAQVSIQLPDNLTTWVLRAVGVDVDTRVGEGAVNVVATKPLLIRPVTPRFLTVGDMVELGAIINNNTDAPQTAEVGLTAAGVTLTTPATQTVTVAAQGEAVVSWQAITSDAPQADLVFSVRNDQYSDASKPRLSTAPNGGLKINRYSAPEVVGTAGDLAEAGSRTEVVALPPNLDTTQGELMVRLDPSLASSIQAGLDYLENYDYDSADAIVSRFLPNVLTYQALVDLGMQDPELKARLETLVREALDQLYPLQNGDGGWSWWKRDTSSPHVTAYVVFGLIRARQAGFEVRADALESGLRYLQNTLQETSALRQYYEFNRQAFVLYVLGEGGQPETTKVDELYIARDNLGIYARALLALAIGRQNKQDERLKTLFADLNGEVIQSATGAHWEEQFVDWWAMNTDRRSTAIVLDALAQLDPENDLAPNVVRWLMASRVDGVWRTTQENAWSLIALTDWMKATGELNADYAFAADLNGENLVEGRAAGAPYTTTVVSVPIAALQQTTSNRLMIGRGEGPGRLYYTAHLRAYLPVPEVKAIDRGLQVQRRYSLASCAEGPKCPALTSAKVGDVIRVNLTLIAPSDLYYVRLEDPLPAGAEVVDTGLSTTSQLAQGPTLVAGDGGWSPYRWWWFWYSRSELRDDRVVLFADYLNKGTYEYVYTLRAASPGQFNVIPTFANETYFPEVFGRGDGMLFTITAE